MQNPRSLVLSLAVAASLAGSAFAQNDDCTGAILVLNGANGPFTNAGSTTSAPAWPCAAGGNDVWFQFIAGSAGTLQADVCGASYDSALQIFDGNGGCGALVSLGCNDDSCGLSSSLTVPVAGPGVYYIRVGGFASQTGNFTLNVNGPSVVGTLATNTALGTGCIQSFASFYENFAAGTLDLGGTSFSMLPSGQGYLVLPGITSYVAPSGTATSLTLTDDSETTVTLSSPFPYPGGTTSSLTVCSNGYVSVASGNGTGFAPVVNTFLNAPQTGWWSWHDFNPLAGGAVKFEEIGGIAYITWDNVRNFAGTTTADDSTFQLQFDTASGIVHFAYQTMTATGNGFLVGYSPGGASNNPGSRDISATLPGTFATADADVLPLSVTGASRPVTGTSWNLNVNNMPPAALIGIDIFGFTDPGVNDLFFLGMPGCPLRSALDVMIGWINTGSHTYSLPIPANPTLVGVHVFTTSAMLLPSANPFGAITANGIDGMVGDL